VSSILTRLRSDVRPWSAWTLRAKLVASMLVLVTLLSLLTSALTIFALDRYLTSEMDKQLAVSLERGPRPNGDMDFAGAEDRGRGPGNEGLVAILGPVQGGWATTTDSNTRTVLTSEQLGLLERADLGSRAEDVRLGADLGTYRVMSRDVRVTINDTPATVEYVVGLPTAPQDRTIGQMLVLAVTGVGIGVLLAGLLGTWLVRRNLAPLRRVAATATRVSQMPLHTGHVALAERVPVEDTDQQTEVGQVGAALNRLLDDQALASRLADAGRRNCDAYTWREVRDRWVDAYRSVSHPHSAPSTDAVPAR
jgi:two-component system OmpR family sensor kinase